MSMYIIQEDLFYDVEFIVGQVIMVVDFLIQEPQHR